MNGFSHLNAPRASLISWTVNHSPLSSIDAEVCVSGSRLKAS